MVLFFGGCSIAFMADGFGGDNPIAWAGLVAAGRRHRLSPSGLHKNL